MALYSFVLMGSQDAFPQRVYGRKALEQMEELEIFIEKHCVSLKTIVDKLGEQMECYMAHRLRHVGMMESLQ